MDLNLHKKLTLHEVPSKFYIQPVDKQDEALVIDRRTGDISIEANLSADHIPPNATSSLIYGLVGIKQLVTCTYLIVITKATKIGFIADSPIYRLDSAKCVPFEDPNESHYKPTNWDESCVAMINSTLQVPNYYFSYNFDLTNSLQRQNSIARNSKAFASTCLAYDKRFLWNHHVISQLERHGPQAYNYCLPLILGFMSINRMDIGQGINWTLISRRSVRRAGTRWNKRGIDRDGNVGNFVETEQVIESHGVRTSFVQVRGSIPLFWQQKTNYSYMPPIEISQHEDHDQSMKKHFDELRFHYGNISMVNLIDHRGFEAKLEREISTRMGHLQKNYLIPYHHFDFHKECGKMRWDRLSLLMDRIDREIESYGFFASQPPGEVICLQSGAIRSNCIDSLDRTNVVQNKIALKMFDSQLRLFKTVGDGFRLKDCPYYFDIFNNVWADNADALSIQYAGTPALKTDFTRTGKRTYYGAVKDGLNSLTRYVSNNFLDSYRQEAIDLLLGNIDGFPRPRSSPLALISYTSSFSITVVCLILLVLYFVFRYQRDLESRLLLQ